MGRKKEYVLLAVLCTVFLMAGEYLFQIWMEYHEADSVYRELQKYVLEKPEEGKEHKRQEENPGGGRDNLPEIDFDGLRAVNEDIVAWIQIPGIGVDYPVVQGRTMNIICIIRLMGKRISPGVFFWITGTGRILRTAK